MAERRQAGEIVVQKFQIICTRTVVFQALEPMGRDGRGHWTHSTGEHIDGVLYGQIGTSSLPASIDSLPAWSEERSEAYQAWHKGECQRAYDAILSAFPEAQYGNRGNGEIVIY